MKKILMLCACLGLSACGLDYNDVKAREKACTDQNGTPKLIYNGNINLRRVACVFDKTRYYVNSNGKLTDGVIIK